MLETPGIEFKNAPMAEEAVHLFQRVPAVRLADCLLVARVTHLGRDRFLTFDAGATKLPPAALAQ